MDGVDNVDNVDSTLFEFINNISATIKTSEFKANDFRYDFRIRLKLLVGLECSESQNVNIETNRKMNKWVKVLDVAFIKITPVLITWSVILPNIATYYFTDLGDSVFQLPVPMW